MGLNKKEEIIFKKRNTRYCLGFFQAHKNLGKLWTAILESYYGIELPELIPSHVVLLMMAVSKINRAASEKGKLVDEDNYVDGKIYLELAQNAKKEEKTMETKDRPKKSDS